MIIEKFKIQLKNLIFDANDNFPLIGMFLMFIWRFFHNFKVIIGNITQKSRRQLNHNTKKINTTKEYSFLKIYLFFKLLKNE